MTNAPVVDLIIAVHDPLRPIRRAVESVIAGMTPERLRVSIICHGIPAGEIQRQLEGIDYSCLRIIEFADGIASPSGPFNEGLRQATGDYVAVMGSDDWFEPGAVDALVSHVERRSSEVVLVRLRHQSGEVLRNPLVRRNRTRDLDVVSDRLFYRTAPLGLIRRELIERNGLRFNPAMLVGEDLEFGMWLWSHASPIDFLGDSPCYVIGADSADRVTMTPRPVSVAMYPLAHLIDQPWAMRLPSRVRRALAVKLLRIHVLGALRARGDEADWERPALAEFSGLVDRIIQFGPGCLRPFARADRSVLEAIRAAPDVQHVVGAMVARSRAPRWTTIVPRNPIFLFDRESTLVRYLLYRVAR
ncbi:glycosyltransferase family 2 protein [Marisediminicola antarctica]|uniref:Glycosyltransferase 2-like domain-containing protein n=1 Tax=Marisediminicola antarctica TaxID=674079 RepID=A0A7L5AJP1_9MICO|nr:glycosyltransferase [Marisediminicola antarctica]QHO70828.1 hypothetical protein BHD05_15425 [Marisediminicola antarctica]